MSEAGPIRCLVEDMTGALREVDPDRPLVIGRGADLDVDSNPYLHRRLVELQYDDDRWWAVNVGSRIPVRLCAVGSSTTTTLAPGDAVQLSAARTALVFSAGQSTYEVEVRLEGLRPPVAREAAVASETRTRSATPLNAAQRLLVLAHVEPFLRRPGTPMEELPSLEAVAARLDWPVTTVNRKLDYLCGRLGEAGVPGVVGRPGRPAAHRRAALVEWALSARVVDAFQLPLLVGDTPSRPG